MVGEVPDRFVPLLPACWRRRPARMGKTLSLDLRERGLAAGLPRRQAAELSGLSAMKEAPSPGRRAATGCRTALRRKPNQCFRWGTRTRHHADGVAGRTRRARPLLPRRHAPALLRPPRDHAERDRARRRARPPQSSEATPKVERGPARSRRATPRLHRRDIGPDRDGSLRRNSM